MLFRMMLRVPQVDPHLAQEAKKRYKAAIVTKSDTLILPLEPNYDRSRVDSSGWHYSEQKRCYLPDFTSGNPVSLIHEVPPEFADVDYKLSLESRETSAGYYRIIASHNGEPLPAVGRVRVENSHPDVIFSRSRTGCVQLSTGPDGKNTLFIRQARAENNKPERIATTVVRELFRLDAEELAAANRGEPTPRPPTMWDGAFQALFKRRACRLTDCKGHYFQA